MDIGIFVDLRNPAGWRRPWAAHYARALERIATAEAMGARSVWISEHHGFDDGYLPQPLTFAAAVAVRTSTIRIGTAIVLGPLRHPRHIAEEAAVVDLLSDGRLELGLGAGYGESEFEAFGVDLGRRYTLNDGALAEVRRLFQSGEVTPPPAQDPLPLWAGYLGPQGARRAGRLGTGLLSLDRALLEPYREGLAEAGHAPAVARMAGAVPMFVADDPERAKRQILPFVAHQQHTYRQLGTPGAPDITEASLAERLDADGEVPGVKVVTAEQAVVLVREATADLPVRHVYVWSGIGGMDDELSDRHLELVFTEVAPALAPVAGVPA